MTFVIGLAFGGATLLAPAWLMALRYLGCVYVLYLAWVLFRAGMIDETSSTTSATFVDGAILLLLNPKAYLIVGLMFTQFLSTQNAGDAWRILWITSVFTINNLVAFTIWAAAGDFLALRFRDPRQARILNMALGSMLAGVAVWMAFT